MQGIRGRPDRVPACDRSGGIVGSPACVVAIYALIDRWLKTDSRNSSPFPKNPARPDGRGVGRLEGFECGVSDVSYVDNVMVAHRIDEDLAAILTRAVPVRRGRVSGLCFRPCRHDLGW